MMVVRKSSEPAEDIFRQLEPKQRAHIESQFQDRVYASGAIIHTPHDQSDQLFLLRTGEVQIYKRSPEERMLRLFVLAPVTIFGEITMRGHWNNFARAMTRCVIGHIERAVMQELLQTSPQLALNVMQSMGQRLNEMESKLVDIAFKNVPQRLAAVLINLAGVPPSTARLAPASPPAIVRYTHQQLAEIIGSYRETVTKTIGEFRERGMIRVEEDVIYLTDMEKLLELVQQ
jgi:CRP-like cAMP-binding protein